MFVILDENGSTVMSSKVFQTREGAIEHLQYYGANPDRFMLATVGDFESANPLEKIHGQA